MGFEELCDLGTPWCMHAVATLRVADYIAEGVTDIDRLAGAVGADCDSLGRVMRHLVGKGVFEEPERGRFALNDAARPLLDSGARLALDLDSFGGRMAGAWNTLLSAVRKGRPAYHEAFGRGFWEDLEANPEIAANFDALMGPAGHGAPDPEVLIDPADWASVRTVVDVGGGAGSLLAAILRARPHVYGTLVDLPRTVARARETFEAAGVAGRATLAGQSFFDPLPAGADVYVLKNVLGDWPDREATAILRRCAEGARPAGRLIVFNSVDPRERASPELLMLVLVGGRGRTVDDLRTLGRDAGLEVRALGKQPSGRGLVEFRTV